MKLAISRRTPPPGPLQSHQLHQKRVSAEPIKGEGLSSHTHAHTLLHLVGADKRNFPPLRESKHDGRRWWGKAVGG